jgi:two-component system, sensor histidine kinase
MTELRSRSPFSAASADTAPWWQRLGWLGAVAFGLLLALLAAVLLQSRQSRLLEQALEPGAERVVLQLLDAEIRYHRLVAAWPSAPPAGEAGAALAVEPTPLLRERFADWTGALDLMQSPPAQRWFEAAATRSVDRSGPALAAFSRFSARASLSLGAAPELPLDAAFVDAGRRELQALEPVVAGLSAWVREQASATAAERLALVREQNRLRMGVTLFLVLLTAAFALIAFRQLQQLRRRRAMLEKLAARLASARQEAESASRAKSTFLANMSHEIRTPFHGLMGMLSLLRETGLSPKQIDYLRTATESADHLLVILNDILDMSQLESGRLTLNPATLDLRALLREVEALMRPQAAAKSLSLHVEVAPAVPERLVADPTRLKQILFNLLANAIKFSERGEVLLDVKTAPDDRGVLEFTVADQGIGIDEATLATLFNRFAQGDHSTSRRHGGTGLGLEISRNLAQLMKGDVLASSRQGVGSRFVLRLPLRPPHEADEHPGQRSRPGATAPTAAAAVAPAAGPDAAVPAAARRRLRLLVAEDHPVNRQYLAALLENLGHDARFAADGRQALAAASDENFDLVLMDLHMPHLDGVAATRAIRALRDPVRSTVPIVALTADTLAETRDRCLVAGMNDFLTKPVSPALLASTLRQFFGSGAAAATAEDAQPLAPGGASAPPLLDRRAIDAALSAMPRERFTALLAEFLEQGPQTVQLLRAAVRDAQPLALRVNAHAVKGAALNLGMAALAATAQALHEGASHLPAHEIARLVWRYEQLLDETRTALSQAGLLAA